MKYNFDEIIKRRETDCLKYDGMSQFYGNNELLPMWVADMDFRTPDFIIDTLKQRLEHPILGYFNRTERFYEAISQWMLRRHQWEIEHNWILFSPGVVPALASIVQALTKPGDNIILQPPVYHPFFHIISQQGRNIVENRLQLVENNYQMDYNDLENKLKSGAKMLILCNPHNPVGRCWKEQELRTLSELCLKHHCIVVSDEIHSDLMINGHKHTVTANLSEEIAENTITCMAPSKTFNLAGLITAEIIVRNSSHREKIRQVIEGGLHIHGGNIFGDLALIAAYENGDEWLNQLLDYLTNNVKIAQKNINEELPLLQTFNHEATYLLWVDFSRYELSHKELSQKLINEAKLALNDGSIFGHGGEKHFRINLACPQKTLEEGIDRLVNCFKHK